MAQLYRDGKRVLECLQRALRAADSCMETATSIELFVEILDRYVYYFDEVKWQGSFGPVALMKVSKNGGTPTEIDRGNAGWIKYLAVDAKQIYFTDISKVYAIAK